MSATLRRTRPTATSAANGASVDPDPLVSLSPPTRRRPSWIVLGTIIVGLAALLGAYVFNAASETIQVMVAAHDLEPGETVEPSDLRVVEMGRTDQLRAIQPQQQDLIVGLAPRSRVPQGTVLNTDLFVSADEVIPAGKTIVGSSLSAGAVPSPTLRAGDAVILLAISGQNLAADAPPSTATELGRAVVWAVEGQATTEGQNSRAWVSLLVDESLQTSVAQAAADDRLRLAMVNE